MAFGFPAYAIEIQSLGAEFHILRSSVCDALSELGWSYEIIDSNTIIARIPISLFSWGEKLTVSFIEDGRIKVKSEGVLRSQCIDWGKNKKNIKLFFSQLHLTISSPFSLNANKSQNMFDESEMTPVEKVLREDKK